MQTSGCQLDRCFLCRHSKPEWKELIAIKKTTLSIKKGKRIFSEGEPVKGLYFLYEGAVKVSMNWGDQKELIIRFARSGDVVGHRGIGGDLFYPISATTLEDSKICFIDNKFLEASLAVNPVLTYQFMQLYAAELQTAEKRMRDLAHREVKGRIAQALLEIATVFGENNDGFISVPITRQDIASYAGTTYETVFKFFTDLLAQHVISASGKHIKINNKEALQLLLKEAH